MNRPPTWEAVAFMLAVGSVLGVLAGAVSNMYTTPGVFDPRLLLCIPGCAVFCVVLLGLPRALHWAGLSLGGGK